jgi:hypothetical protein
MGTVASGVSGEVLRNFVFAGVSLRAVVYQVPTRVTLSYTGLGGRRRD